MLSWPNIGWSMPPPFKYNFSDNTLATVLSIGTNVIWWYFTPYTHLKLLIFRKKNPWQKNVPFWRNKYLLTSQNQHKLWTLIIHICSHVTKLFILFYHKTRDTKNEKTFWVHFIGLESKETFCELILPKNSCLRFKTTTKHHLSRFTY